MVAKDIFRKFPNKYDSMIKDFTAKRDEFFEPDSKSAIIWIIGEYAEKIPEAEKIIDSFIDMFQEEPVKV
jgi:AP-1 complex subunit beta-1